MLSCHCQRGSAEYSASRSYTANRLAMNTAAKPAVVESHHQGPLLLHSPTSKPSPSWLDHAWPTLGNNQSMTQMPLFAPKLRSVLVTPNVELAQANLPIQRLLKDGHEVPELSTRQSLVTPDEWARRLLVTPDAQMVLPCAGARRDGLFLLAFCATTLLQEQAWST